MNQDQQMQLLQMACGVPHAPHQVIAYSFSLNPQWSPARIVAELSDIPLSQLQQQLAIVCIQEWQLAEDIVTACFDPLRQKLNCKLNELWIDDTTRQKHVDLLDRVAGEITLRDYYDGEPEADVARWREEIEVTVFIARAQQSGRLVGQIAPEELQEGRLIVRAQQGQPEAFAELYSAREKALRGYIGGRGVRDEDVEDIAQKAWTRIWQKLSTYDPAHSFQAFIRYWAGIMVKRYHKDRGDRRQVETLFSEMAARYPDLKQEAEIADIVESASAPHDWTMEEIILMNEMWLKGLCDDGPPHQIMAFGFSKLLGWKPARIVAELSDELLAELLKRLVVECGTALPLLANRAVPCFKQLRKKMGQQFGQVVKDKKTRKIYPQLAEHKIGETFLQDYYTSKPEDNIVQWAYAVERRIRSKMIREGKVPKKLLKEKQKKKKT